MTAVERLVTLVDIADDPGDAHHMSVSARHEAVLADGRSVLLLDGRGWSSRLNRRWGKWSADDIWATTSVGEIDETARMVVGPDEPFGGTTAETEAAHWAALSGVLRQAGVDADPDELKQLPHEVTVSERLRARLAGDGTP